MKAPRSITNHLHRQKTIEWSVMALMLLLCGGLTALQYHWTGEVARAEITRLRAGLERQLKNLCQEFDGELARDYEDLVPSVREMEGKSQEAALLARYNEWMQSSPRPVFKRIVFATPTNGSIQLFELNQQQHHLETLNWPSSWAGLRENLSQKIRGPGGPGGPQGYGGPNGPGRSGQSGDRWSFTSERRLSPPNEGRGPGGPFDDRGSRAMDNRFGIFTDAMGTLVEYPIFTGAPRGGPPSMQWLIFELDMTYVTNSWLPELIAHYLNVGGKNVNNFAVTLSARPHTALLSTVPNPQAFEGSAVTTFNPQFGIGRARDLGPSDGRWKFAVSHRPDSLDALVAVSRRRNLGLAILLNGLMLAAGVFLVATHAGRVNLLSARCISSPMSLTSCALRLP